MKIVEGKGRKWKKGDVIQMSPLGRYYNYETEGGTDYNPTGVKGVVVEANRGYAKWPLEVEWENGTSNYYDYLDLMSWEDS
jgi:hypothetical protein